MFSAAKSAYEKFVRLRGWHAGAIVLACAIAAAALALGWHRVASFSFLALALAVLPCGIACAAGLWLLDRRKGGGACHGGHGIGAGRQISKN